MHHEEFEPLTLPHQGKSSCPNNKKACAHWLKPKKIENFIESDFISRSETCVPSLVIWMDLPTKRK